MKPFDGRIGKRLPYETVGDMRFFAFYIGNGTILTGTKWDAEYNIDIILEPSDVLGNIFALELFRNKGIEGGRKNNSKKLGTNLSSSELIGEYIQSLNNKSQFSIFLNKLQSENRKNWRDVVVRFFKDLGNRNLQTTPLINYKSVDKEEKDDYALWIISEGDYLEKTTAIFCNILRMDKEFNVINEEWARHRISQYIRKVNDDSYKVIPRFKEWERTLWM
ncbi:MAG: hypothetical protein AB8B69_15030 [Chitinophagales bacterium]